MESKNVSEKKSIGGIVLDIITIGLLFASFAALFYSGFILQVETFPLGALCAITAVGLLLLFFIGDVSCLSSKVKNHSLSVGFLVFSAIQTVALIVNLALLLAIMVKLFTVDSLAARLTYVITTVIVLLGYVASVCYFSDGTVGITSDEEDSDEDEAEEDAEETVDEADEEDAAEGAEEMEETAAEPESQVADEIEELSDENDETAE